MWGMWCLNEATRLVQDNLVGEVSLRHILWGGTWVYGRYYVLDFFITFARLAVYQLTVAFTWRADANLLKRVSNVCAHLPLWLTAGAVFVVGSSVVGLENFHFCSERQRENNFTRFWTSVEVHGAEDWDVGNGVSPCPDQAGWWALTRHVGHLAWGKLLYGPALDYCLCEKMRLFRATFDRAFLLQKRVA